MLTETRPDGSWSVSGIDFKDCKGNMYGALCRLRDYEKTGLNPEDFRSDSYEKNICIRYSTSQLQELSSKGYCVKLKKTPMLLQIYLKKLVAKMYL